MMSAPGVLGDRVAFALIAHESLTPHPALHRMMSFVQQTTFAHPPRCCVAPFDCEANAARRLGPPSSG